MGNDRHRRPARARRARRAPRGADPARSRSRSTSSSPSISRAAGETDALDDTVDYAAVAEAVSRVVQLRALPAARAPGDPHRRGVSRRRARHRRRGHGAQAAPAGAGDGRPRRGVHRAVTHGRVRRVRAYLGIGSNLGDRLAHLQLAVDGLAAADGVDVVAVSPVYETAPVGGPEQPDYLNAVVAVDTAPRRARCSSWLSAIEAAADRVRRCAGVRAPSTSTCSWSATSRSTSPTSWCRTRG